MKDEIFLAKSDYAPVHQQSLSNDLERKDDEQETQAEIHEEENESDKDHASDILKKYLECLKSPSGKRRRRCISQELG